MLLHKSMQGILWGNKVKTAVKIGEMCSEGIFIQWGILWGPLSKDSHALFVKTNISGHRLIMQITVSLAQRVCLSSFELRPRICILTNTPCFSYCRNTREQWSQPWLHIRITWEALKSQGPSHTPNQGNHTFWRWDAGFSILLSVPDESVKLQWLGTAVLENCCSVAVLPKTIRVPVVSFVSLIPRPSLIPTQSEFPRR